MITSCCVFACHVFRLFTAIGLGIAGCGDIEFCETVIGLGEPAEVAEYIPELGLFR